MAVQCDSITETSLENQQSTPAPRFRSRLRKATPIIILDEAKSLAASCKSPRNVTFSPLPQKTRAENSTELENNTPPALKDTTDTPNHGPPEKSQAVVIRKFTKPQPTIPSLECAPLENESEVACTAKEVGQQTNAKATHAKHEKEKEKKLSAKKKFKRGENPEKTKMTMFDWIYWNPETNPMMYTEEEMAAIQKNASQTPSDANSSQTEKSTDVSLESEIADCDNGEQVEDCIPVPQVMIGPDGNIIIDEKSLLIPTSGANKDLTDSPLVYGDAHTTYASFSKRRGKKSLWSNKETTKFYKALSTVGTDFSLMLDIFPDKSRHELKLKFKREEKQHKALVEQAISDGQQFDLSVFNDSDDGDEDALIGEQIKEAKKVARKRYIKKKLLSNSTGQPERNAKRKKRKIMDDSTSESEDGCKNIEDEVNLAATQRKSPPRNDAIASIAEAMEDAVGGGNRPDAVLNFDINDPTNMSRKDIWAEKDGQGGENVDGDDDGVSDHTEEVIESLLKTTRYGRQPKRRIVFTADMTKRPKAKNKHKMQELSQVDTQE